MERRGRGECAADVVLVSEAAPAAAAVAVKAGERGSRVSHSAEALLLRSLLSSIVVTVAGQQYVNLCYTLN